jgi:tricorn protease-like protein
LASASTDQTVRLWEAATGKELRPILRHEKAVVAVAFSPDGQVLASGDSDGLIRLWQAATGKEIRQLKGHDREVHSVAFSPDGRILASASWDQTIQLWDLTTGKALRRLTGHDDWVFHVALSPDGRTLASASRDRTVRLWEVATGKERARYSGAVAMVSPVVFSPDGKTLISGSHDQVIRLWEMATGKERRQLIDQPGWPKAFALAPDGKTLFSGSEDSTILIWDLKNLAGEVRPVSRLSAKEADALWTDLGSDDAAKSFRAINLLAAAPAQTVALLRERLPPAPGVDARTARLIADLDSDAFANREAAARELEQLGAAIEPLLRQTLKDHPSAEVRRRVEQLLANLEKPHFIAEALRGPRAIEVLEQMGTPEARQLLEELARGAADARRTQEAKAALGRHARKSSSR